MIAIRELLKTDLGMAKKFGTFAHFCGVRRNDPPADGQSPANL